MKADKSKFTILDTIPHLRFWFILAASALALITLSGIASASYPVGSWPTAQSEGSAKDPGRQPSAPLTTITWGPEMCTSCPNSALSPFASLHPTDPLFALVAGAGSIGTIGRTTNGGSSWTSLAPPPWPALDYLTNAWLPSSPNQDWAIGSSIDTNNPSNITEGRTTDRGATWSSVASNISNPGLDSDFPRVWADQEPTSPFYGRAYLTFTLYDTQVTGSYNAVALKYTSDQGSSWSSAVVQQSGSMSATEGDLQDGSLAFQSSGNIVMGWMDAICCGFNPTLGDFNKYHWARSTDGGATFPVSGTIATDTRPESVAFNDLAPSNTRWTPQLDVAGDPVDGTLYAVWLKFRTGGLPQGTGAAVAFARSTDDGATWTLPAYIYNDPDPAVAQLLPWVAVSRDHTVHVTFSSNQPGAPSMLAHYYVQSTDQGATWTAPFQLSGVTYPATTNMGAYNTLQVGAYQGQSASIISAWTDNRAGLRHYARIGTFPIGGTPTPTPTATATAIPTCTSVGAWTIVANYPLAITHNMVASDGTYVYSFGGSPSGQPATNAVYRYDPVANAWTALANLPVRLYDSRAVYSAVNNKVYVFGGVAPDANFAIVSTVYIYDIATDSWSSGADMPAPREESSVAYYSANQKIYVIGGYDGFGPAKDQTWEYDPTANSWNTSRANIPTDMLESATAIVGQYIYLMGNRGDPSCGDFSCGSRVHYRYDILNNIWEARALLPAPTFAASAGAVGNMIVMFGGIADVFHTSGYKTTYVYDTAADTWASGPDMNVAHSFIEGTAIGSQLIVVGGDISGTDRHTVEMSFVSGPCVAATTTATPTTPTTPSTTATPTAVASSTSTDTPTDMPTNTPLPAATGTDTPTPTITSTPTATCGTGEVVGTIGPWAPVATYTVVVEGPAVTGDGTYAYSIGGFNPNGGSLNLVQRFDPATNTWTPRANLPQRIVDASAAYAAFNNKIYVFGGTEVFDSLRTVYIYDIASNSWTRGADMPASRKAASVAYYNGNHKIYVMGGYSSDSPGTEFSQTWEYDPVANTWDTSRANIPSGMGASATSIVGQYIYLMGNESSTGLGTTLNYRYDIINNTWTARAPLPVDTYAANAGVVGTSIVMFGGFGGGGFPPADLNTSYIYDSLTDSWASGPSMTTPHAHAGGTAIGNVLIVIGGDRPSETTNIVETALVSTICLTPTVTPTPSSTQTSTPTATVTPTACGSNQFVNPGFETGQFSPWVVDNSNPPPFVAQTPTYPNHSGTYSAHIGSLPGGETPGDSSFYQTLTVPPSGGTLSYWYWPRTLDSISFDWQDVYVQNMNGVTLATIMHECSNSQVWIHVTFDMSAFARQTVRIKFLVHEDNFGDPTDMFVDDAQLLPACATATSTIVATATATATVCGPSALQVLYDQNNNPAANSFATLSQQFGDFPIFSAQTADDFAVPVGQSWSVSEVDARGIYYNGAGPATSFNVYFYRSVVSGTYSIPGAPVYTATAQSYIKNSGVFSITLATPAILPGGVTYFVSPQAVMNFSQGGQWDWADRTVQANGPASWRSPGGGFGNGCRSWDRRTFCVGDASASDQMFRLVGFTDTLCRTATPTPTNTPTPGATCAAGRLLIGSGLAIGNPANNYGQLASNMVSYTWTHGNSSAPQQKFAVFQARDPWGATVIKDAITAQGRAFSVFTPQQLAGFNFAQYRVVLLNWDSHLLQEFQPYYQNAISALQTYVLNGGVLWVQGAFVGQAGNAIPMPFGGTAGFDPQTVERVMIPSNPMVAGMQTNFTGHPGSLADFSTPPGGANTVVRAGNANGPASLYEYWLPGGCVPATVTRTVTPTPATPTPTPNCAVPAGPWTIATPYPIPITHQAVASNGNYAYSIGGLSSGGETSQVQRYDPATNTWLSLANLPISFYWGAATYAPANNKIYVFGGEYNPFPNETILSTVYIYDIASDSWTQGADMPAPRALLSVAYYSGNQKIYVMGGVSNIAFGNQTWEYDPLADTWNTNKANIPALIGGSATSIVGQYIYLMGNNLGGTTQHYRYDILNNAWTTRAALPAPDWNASAGAVGNFIFLFGNQSSTTTQIYNTLTNTWSTGPDMNSMHSYAGGTVVGNLLIVVGGFPFGQNNIVETAPVNRSCTTPLPTLPPTRTPTRTATPTRAPTGTPTRTPTFSP